MFMKKIGIIHLSDIHFCPENRKVICHQLNKLLSDINKTFVLMQYVLPAI